MPLEGIGSCLLLAVRPLSSVIRQLLYSSNSAAPVCEALNFECNTAFGGQSTPVSSEFGAWDWGPMDVRPQRRVAARETVFYSPEGSPHNTIARIALTYPMLTPPPENLPAQY